MLKYLTNAISSAIGFTKTESRGTLVLILIIFIALVTSQVRISYLKNRKVIAADSSALVWVKTVQASYEIKDPVEKEFDKNISVPKNTSYLKSDDKPIKKPKFKTPEKREALIVKDLNTATQEDLQTIRGIGPAFSERIIKYRNLLGGFADTTQLSEIYGLKSETTTELLKYFHIKSNVTPINLNTDSIKVLGRHPYISYDLARIILNYRKEHGDIRSPSDLKKIKAIDQGTFLRLKPYLE